MQKTARAWVLHVVFLFLLFIVGSLVVPASIWGQTSTPTPTTTLSGNSTQWSQPDPIITELGKNSERARQLVWWVFSHPAVHAAPVIASMWAVSRNIMYILVVLVIVAFGLGLILSRRQTSVGPIFSGIASPLFGVNLPSILLKIAVLLLYITFSYVFVLGLIQTSEVLMRFFIENVGGRDLFNVVFSGAGNSEGNYINFVGHKDLNPLNQEMVNTSIFLIRLTSMTYYSMAAILILRTIILWFLLIVSPFLALLIPFVFIRNVGWIWIGVFFQWLFYGPLLSLFLAALTRIWVSGIPFPFDFSRVNKPEGQVYRTAINILYGGPAQTLSPGNSANYIDTYAEYVIALVMLWTCMILPWLLLRIFRDYCCDAIRAGNAMLGAILERIRQYPPPPPPPPPPGSGGTIGTATALPFRTRLEEKLRERSVTHIQDVKEISRTQTNELTRAMQVSVTSLADVSRLETNDLRREQVVTELNKISIPENISAGSDRARYQAVRSELLRRASQGDRVAQSVLTAADTRREQMTTRMARISQSREVERVQPLTAAVSAQPMIVDHVARQSGVNAIQVQTVLSAIPSASTATATVVAQTAQKTHLAESKVQEIIALAQQSTTSVMRDPAILPIIAKRTEVPAQAVEKVMTHIATAGTVSEEKVKEVAKETALSESKVKEVVEIARLIQLIANPIVVSTISQQTGIAQEKVRDVILTAPPQETKEVVEQVSEKTKLEKDKVREILDRVYTIIIAHQPAVLTTIAQRTGIKEDVIQKVLGIVQTTTTPTPVRMTQAAKEAHVSLEVIQDIVTAAKEASAAGAGTEGPVPSSPVSLEDYEEVKSMWLTHYRSAPVPVSETIKTRSDWIQSEEKKLANIANHLASHNVQIKEKGLEQVAEILPFMLLGGFSDAEVLTYVQAKYQAAKQTDQELIKEERLQEEIKTKVDEEFVEIKPQKKEAVKHATLTEERTVPVASVSVSQGTRATDFSDTFDTNTITSVQTVELVKKLQLVVSSLLDILRIETDSEHKARVIIELTNVARPDQLPIAEDQERYRVVRTELTRRATAGDTIAQSVLRAADTSPDVIVQTLAKEAEVRQAKSKHRTMEAAIAEKPQLVAHITKQTGIAEPQVQAVLASIPMTAMTPSVQMEQDIAKTTALPQQIVHNVIAAAHDVPVPASTVSLEDYEEVKSMWVNHYRSAPIPVTETVKTRQDWIALEEKKLSNILNDLASPNRPVKEKGLEQVAEILPFMLLGGFSDAEVLTYVQAKYQAAKQMTETLTKETGKPPEEFVSVAKNSSLTTEKNLSTVKDTSHEQ